MVKEIVSLSCSHVGIGAGGTIAMLGEVVLTCRPRPPAEVGLPVKLGWPS